MPDQNVTLVEPVQTIPAEGPPEAKKTRQMTFTVEGNGDIVSAFGEGIEPVILNPTQVPEALSSAALTEGLISRLRSYTSKLTDAARTPEALRAAVAKGAENLKAGIWKVERAPGEGVEFSIEAEASYLFRKMRAEAKGEDFTGTLAEAAAAFSALSDEQKKQLKALSRYQLAYTEVKEARAKAAKAKLLAKIAKEDEEAGAPM